MVFGSLMFPCIGITIAVFLVFGLVTASANSPTAQIELLEEDREITGGDIYDHDLKKEVLRRIKANTSVA